MNKQKRKEKLKEIIKTIFGFVFIFSVNLYLLIDIIETKF